MTLKNAIARFLVGKILPVAVCSMAMAVLSTGFAAAAPANVISKVNLRLGPGTTYGVVATIPGGSVVDVSNCAAEWCTVHWRGRVGYAVARNLDVGGAGPAGAPGPYPAAVSGPPVVVVGPGYGPGYYGPGFYGPGYWGPGYGWGPRYGGGWRRW